MKMDYTYVLMHWLSMINHVLKLCFSAAYQRIAWEALKKSINGLINKVSVSNVAVIVQELIQENVIRGRSVTSSTYQVYELVLVKPKLHEQ